jgi:hypothetical protein
MLTGRKKAAPSVEQNFAMIGQLTLDKTLIGLRAKNVWNFCLMLPKMSKKGMKTIACISIPVIIMAAVLLQHKDDPNKDEALVPLPKGKTNPPLERLGPRWPIPTGAEVWYGTNQLPCGIVVECEEDHEFDGRVDDGVAIRFSNGNLISWVPRHSTKGLWIRAAEVK